MICDLKMRLIEWGNYDFCLGCGVKKKLFSSEKKNSYFYWFCDNTKRIKCEHYWIIIENIEKYLLIFIYFVNLNGDVSDRINEKKNATSTVKTHPKRVTRTKAKKKAHGPIWSTELAAVQTSLFFPFHSE